MRISYDTTTLTTDSFRRQNKKWYLQEYQSWIKTATCNSSSTWFRLVTCAHAIIFTLSYSLPLSLSHSLDLTSIFPLWNFYQNLNWTRTCHLINCSSLSCFKKMENYIIRIFSSVNVESLLGFDLNLNPPISVQINSIYIVAEYIHNASIIKIEQ